MYIYCASSRHHVTGFKLLSTLFCITDNWSRTSSICHAHNDILTAVMVLACGTTMALEGQQRDGHDEVRALSRADTWSSVSSEGSQTSDDAYLATDDAGGGHVNLAMDPVLNQPAAAAINVTNSSDVHIGPRLSYNAPVTINQYVNVAPDGEQKQVAVSLPLHLNGTAGKTALSGIATVGGTAGAGADRGARARTVPWWRRRKVQAAAGAVVVLLVAVGVLVALLLPSDGNDAKGTRASEQYLQPMSPLPPKDTPPDPDFVMSDGRQIIRSFEWSDVPPEFVRPLHHPTPYVVIGHTAGVTCKGEVECFPVLRNYRDDHRAKWGQPDIVYNFLIDVDGNVYEGRGWDATNNYKSWTKRCNLAVSLFGNFVYDNVTERMTQSLKQLLDLGVRIGKLAKDYRLIAQSQVMPTLSPGKNVLELIKDWDHRCLSDCDVGVQCIYIDPHDTNPDNSSTSISQDPPPVNSTPVSEK